MNLTTRVILSLVIAIASATIVSVIITGTAFILMICTGFIVARLASGLIGQGSATPSRAGSIGGRSGAEPEDTSAQAFDEGDRELGTVKWFNVSKGFGFITKEDGEEIFVHFRSIRGEGRRSLRDGQEVSFVVVESDKGPQAEDVVGENRSTLRPTKPLVWRNTSVSFSRPAFS